MMLPNSLEQHPGPGLGSTFCSIAAGCRFLPHACQRPDEDSESCRPHTVYRSDSSTALYASSGGSIVERISKHTENIPLSIWTVSVKGTQVAGHEISHLASRTAGNKPAGQPGGTRACRDSRCAFPPCLPPGRSIVAPFLLRVSWNGQTSMFACRNTQVPASSVHAHGLARSGRSDLRFDR